MIGGPIRARCGCWCLTRRRLVRFVALQPTNHLDMEAIDALALAVNEFKGGLVLVSHDMRLISQVAKEIWICDNRCITKFKGDIQQFKMTMRDQIEKDQEQVTGKLRGDASTLKKEASEDKKDKPKKPAPPKLQVVKPQPPTQAMAKLDIDDDATAATETTATTETTVTTINTTGASSAGSYVPPHLRGKDGSGASNGGSSSGGAYVPPHLRRKAQQEQQQDESQ